ncbi:zinc transporter ZIP13 isoform X1 [Gorilla gorilla gorilla]|uniref:zinc transporter ZIP13 isoform X1 n=1 Tax=Gorilla gorilla gorilla TaxID=9595 RepID=UPI003008AA3E
MPGCPCPGCGMAGPRLLFLTALALELLGRAGGSQPALRSRGTATACRLDNKESESWGALLSGERLDTWICSLLGSLVVGLSGVFPLLVIPLEMGTMLRSEAGAWRLKQLLSFALGGLLGNVFLHLLPEAWAYTCSASPGGEGQSLQQQQQLGLWVIAGILTFLALEKMFLDSKEEGTSQAPNKDPTAAAAALNGGHCLAQPAAEPGLGAVVRSIKVSGYLNLLANTIDNFTHGLAVAASFLVSKKIGLLTTMAILLHEIPHEVGDFAILLRAGFDRWSAAKLQLSTALGGLLGAGFAICTQSPKGVGTGVAGGGGGWHQQRGPSQRVWLPHRWSPGPGGGEHTRCPGRRGADTVPWVPSWVFSPCRGDGSLGPALHLWRLSLHRLGERAP